MASFLEELWNSIFTPGPTPTLLVATNAAFAALQFLLLALLVATYSIHFLVLSVLSGGLWYAINWFAAEVVKEQRSRAPAESNEKSADLDNASDTETEKVAAAAPAPAPTQTLKPGARKPAASDLLDPSMSESAQDLRRRRSRGEQSGYISTDSEWEKVSEGEERSQ